MATHDANGPEPAAATQTRDGTAANSPPPERPAEAGSPALDAALAKRRISVRDLCTATTDADQDMQDAAEALGGLRYASGDGDDSAAGMAVDGSATHFMNRVTQYPLLSSTMRVIGNIAEAYEHSKESSAVVRYGAQAVESSVKTVTKPLLNRYIEPNLDRIDRFACDQLDRLERSFSSMASPNAGASRRRTASSDLMHPPSLALHPYGGELHQRRSSRAGAAAGGSAPIGTAPQDQVASTGDGDADAGVLGRQWGNVKAGAGAVGATVGGYVGSWMISEESMNGIRYCEQWLQYAVQNIEHQVAVLQQALAAAASSAAALLHRPTAGSGPETALASTHGGSSLAETVAQIRRSIVDTVRSVVDVLGRYTPAYLPAEARNRIREFLLALPNRLSSGASASSALDSSNGADLGNVHEREAQQVIQLANESASMLQSIGTVFTQARERRRS